ncbi:cyclopropane fatty acyl phospholipid synthase (plasmid) [Streptomyces virginiae]|uniref:cyclopropane fatty acyl phospholipid synthase n=1 Tax=Streptomyces virginiae TaxID=1961 RepID=UPI002F90D117
MIADQALVRRTARHAGITIDGDKPHDIRVHNERFYSRVVTQGSLGLGESYMEGWWDCDRLDEMFCRLLDLDRTARLKLSPREWLRIGTAYVGNRQTLRRARDVTRAHYDLGNRFFEQMLDKRMVYSCGYWKGAASLDEAQEQKLDLICRKLELAKGDRILDIGCGWGGLVQYAAERHGCECVGLTLSAPQADYAAARCGGLPVQIVTGDYRGLTQKKIGTFDKIVSVGMFEHVGPRNHRTFMRTVQPLLADRGLFLLHTIGDNRSRMRADPWLDRYIFPNGVAPSVRQLGQATEGLFVMEDWHNFGPDYYRTLMAWHERYENSPQQLPDTTSLSAEEFRRMWRYYLQSFASAFEVRHLQLWQIVLAKTERRQRYESIR